VADGLLTMNSPQRSDVVIAGGGIGAIATALQLLDCGLRVTLAERGGRDRFGGLANEAFGGMLFAGTPVQRRNRIADSPELLARDWFHAAEFGADEVWPKKWATAYIERCVPEVHDWLRGRGLKFFPVVHWVERGDFGPGNSVPRYHLLWGTGWHLAQTLIRQLEQHPARARLTLLFQHQVTDLIHEQGRVAGLRCLHDGREVQLRADATVIAAGGINGNLARVREVWDRDCYGEPPALLLNGSDPHSDGALHDRAALIGARVVRLGQMWNYASGVRHPEPRYPDHGLSLIAPRSALWMDGHGRRVGPDPMISGFDTHRLCQRMGRLPGQYGWLLMNRKIFLREMSVSGSHINPHFRDRHLVRAIAEVMLGNARLYDYLTQGCPDVVTAAILPELAQKMQQVAPDVAVDLAGMQADIAAYDGQIARGAAFHDDDQLRRIAQLRLWRGDRARTLRFQPIVDSGAMPLVAVRVMLLSRKSMGGMETDLHSRVLGQDGQPLPGLYAVGEACGFGGGGIAGRRSLEGTFLSCAIFNGRVAARAIAGRADPLVS
jgi:predicted oxidoreductase